MTPHAGPRHRNVGHLERHCDHEGEADEISRIGRLILRKAPPAITVVQMRIMQGKAYIEDDPGHSQGDDHQADGSRRGAFPAFELNHQSHDHPRNRAQIVIRPMLNTAHGRRHLSIVRILARRPGVKRQCAPAGQRQVMSRSPNRTRPTTHHPGRATRLKRQRHRSGHPAARPPKANHVQMAKPKRGSSSKPLQSIEMLLC